MLREGPLSPAGQPVQIWRRGSHWARPEIAAFFAEDRVGSDLDTDDVRFQAPGRPVLLATQISSLQYLGRLVADEQSADAPVESRLGRSFEEIQEDLTARPNLDWRQSLRLLGSFACVHVVPVASRHLVPLIEVADVARLAAAPAPIKALRTALG